MISSEETISRTTYSTAMYLWNNGVPERDIPSEAGSSGWSWSTLRKINIFFDNYTRCEDKVAALKYEGVARFFRAWFYFDKVKSFGGVPWYDTEIQTDDEDLLYKPRDSREFIMDKVIEDLEIAVDRLGTTRKPDQISNGLRWPSSHVYASMKVPTANITRN